MCIDIFMIISIPDISIVDVSNCNTNDTVVKYNEVLRQFHYIMKKIGKHIEITHTFNSPNPYGLFLRDVVIKLERGYVLCNMKNPERIQETDYISNNIKPIIYRVKYPGTIEGGDVLITNDVTYIGYGERTNLNAIQQLMKHNVFETTKICVIRCTTKKHNEIHLDLLFNVLDENTVLLSNAHKNSKCSIYTKSSEGVYVPEISNRSITEILEGLSCKIIYVSEKSQKNFGCNTIVYNNTVVSQDKDVSRQLRDNGFDVISIKMDKINYFGGGIHCLTNDI